MTLPPPEMVRVAVATQDGLRSHKMPSWFYRWLRLTVESGAIEAMSDIVKRCSTVQEAVHELRKAARDRHEAAFELSQSISVADNADLG